MVCVGVLQPQTFRMKQTLDEVDLTSLCTYPGAIYQTALHDAGRGMVFVLVCWDEIALQMMLEVVWVRLVFPRVPLNLPRQLVLERWRKVGGLWKVLEGKEGKITFLVCVPGFAV